MQDFVVIYEKGETSWGAYVPDLPGCVAVGDTREEVENLIQGAITMHLEGLQELGETLPPVTHWAKIVSVPALSPPKTAAL